MANNRMYIKCGKCGEKKGIAKYYPTMHHEYEVTTAESSNTVLTKVVFQKGPIKEAGVNGCHNEDLIAMVLDRLQSFQSSEYNCRENALAITKLEEALFWLRARTDGREERGVEGTHAI